VANEGFVRRHRVEATRVTAGRALYHLNRGTVLPRAAGELRVRDVILAEAARGGEFSRESLLMRTGQDTPAGRRVFAELVRLRAIVRTNAATVVHLGRESRLPGGPTICVIGRVVSLGREHPRKRRLSLELEGGGRAIVLAYGGEAGVAATLAPGASVQVVGVRLGAKRLEVRATKISRLP